MRIRFDCYLNGRKATAELLADKYYRKLVYKAMRPYYLAMGCYLNLVSSKMTDAIGNIVERKLYRQEVKYCGRMAMEEMDRLTSQIKNAIVENEVFGGDDYQYWQDVVDAMEDRFRPKVARLQTVIKKYIEKFDIGDEDFRASICVVSAISHYMRGSVFKEIRDDRLKEIQIDVNDVFMDADGGKILKWWEKLEELTIPTEKVIDFKESKSCYRALESFIILFNKPATFRMPLRFAKQQRVLRHPEIDWKKKEREDKKCWQKT